MDIKRWDYQLEITENKNICLNFYKFSVVSKEIANAATAGQFCMIGLEKVFLRRPLSIYSVDKKNGTVSFLYKVVGKGTDILANLSAGSKINILGPLGQGYNLQVKDNVESVLVAGGTGIASIHFLASSLSKPGSLYYGVRKKEELMCLNEFEKLGWKINISTEDGSFGYKGFVTDLLAKQIKQDSIVFVCGPTPMMKKVAEIVKDKKVSGYASLEQKMACGVGNCQGCAVKINNAYKMACKDGPVFPLSDITFE
ncbi:MAG: dihydroorotate dehydrogenase electron transfer subunit [Elusimicrobia bacterium]|nr:dihydroorotate dehydrogenase electron transfer subunit [Elusimicrobiota bacterium]